MIRFNLLFNLIFIGLLSPAMSIALPIQITVLKVNVGKRYNELIIVHDAPVETKKMIPDKRSLQMRLINVNGGKLYSSILMILCGIVKAILTAFWVNLY